MSDRKNDPAEIWKNQPLEEDPMTAETILNRRTEALHASTRSEILMSIGAALLLVGVILWRFGLWRNPIEEIGCVLAIVWTGVTLYRLRAQIWSGPAASR